MRSLANPCQGRAANRRFSDMEPRRPMMMTIQGLLHRLKQYLVAPKHETDAT